jgi:predicted metal-dependent hydrolase
MISQIKLNGLVVEVTLKKIKNIHLRVYPPHGQVKISAPLHIGSDTLRAFVISKTVWIKRQQHNIRAQQRELPRDGADPDSYYVWGQRYLLTVIEHDAPPHLVLNHSEMRLHVRPALVVAEKRQRVIEAWYREQLKIAVPPLIEKWQPIMNVNVQNFFVQKMKTRWGSCNYVARTIRLNMELAKKPADCLEYVLVHELVHLLEPTHNRRFYSLMGQFMPNWKCHKAELNRWPL